MIDLTSLTDEQKLELFCKKMLLARKNQGLLQQEAADLIGIHVNALGRIERGQLKPSFKTCLKIHEVLKMPKKYAMMPWDF